MATQKLRWTGIILSVIGIVLVIVGILWVTVIFPALAQIPKDYERTYYSDGTFSVLNSETQSMDSFPIEQALAQKGYGRPRMEPCLSIRRAQLSIQLPALTSQPIMAMRALWR